jgi:hypothetical protein
VKLMLPFSSIQREIWFGFRVDELFFFVSLNYPKGSESL